MAKDEDGKIILGLYKRRKILRERELKLFVVKRLLSKNNVTYE